MMIKAGDPPRELEVEVERLTREQDELKRSLERAEYLLRDLEMEKGLRKAAEKERDVRHRQCDMWHRAEIDAAAQRDAAEARLVRAREALEALRQKPAIFPEDWDEAIRALADSAPAGRAALAAEVDLT
jgi:hypothetical protein